MTRRPITALLLALPALLLGVPASAGDATRFAIEEDQMLIAFSASLGAHKQLVGSARSLAGTVQLTPEGAQVKLRLPVAALETGSALTDEALRALLDAAQFPTVELEATAPEAGGREASVTFAGTLHLHGASVPVKVPAKLLLDGRLAFVHAVFPINLGEFGVSGAMVGGALVGDRVEISVDARLHTLPEGQAVAAF